MAKTKKGNNNVNAVNPENKSGRPAPKVEETIADQLNGMVNEVSDAPKQVAQRGTTYSFRADTEEVNLAFKALTGLKLEERESMPEPKSIPAPVPTPEPQKEYKKMEPINYELEKKIAEAKKALADKQHVDEVEKKNEIAQKVKSLISAKIGSRIISRKTSQECLVEGREMWAVAAEHAHEYNKLNEELFEAQKLVIDMPIQIKTTIKEIEKTIALDEDIKAEEAWCNRNGNAQDKKDLIDIKNAIKATSMVELVMPLEQKLGEAKKSIEVLTPQVKEVRLLCITAQDDANNFFREAEEIMMTAYGNAVTYTRKPIIK